MSKRQNTPQDKGFQRMIRAIRRARDIARQEGFNLMYILDAGSHWDFDTTGTPHWTSDASDVLTSFSEELIQEDEHAIDELLNKFNNEINESWN